MFQSSGQACSGTHPIVFGSWHCCEKYNKQVLGQSLVYIVGLLSKITTHISHSFPLNSEAVQFTNHVDTRRLNDLNDMMQSAKFALFLGDLSMTCHEADLEEAFSPYGTILEIRVKRSKETAKTLSYGFLEFDSANAAVTAMNEMDGQVLKGRPLRLVIYLFYISLCIHVRCCV